MSEQQDPPQYDSHTPSDAPSSRCSSPTSSAPSDVPPEIEEPYCNLSAKMHGLFLGPMPVSSFLDTFLPERSKRPGIRLPAFPSSLSEIPRSLLSAMRILAPSLYVYDTRAPSNQDKATSLSTCFSFYSNPAAERVGGPVCADFAEMELFVRTWPEAFDDPFTDWGCGEHYPFEIDEQPANGVRGRLIACAAAMSTLQYRTHMFSFAIFGGYARLMRWDQSGVVVSQDFLYRKTHYLAEFLWRFDAMSPTARGRDPTVIRIDDPWPTHLAPADALEKLQEGNNKTNRDRLSHRHFCLMKLPDHVDSTRETDVLISFPPGYNINSHVPHAHSTRRLDGYDVQKRRLVFIKQYWRNAEPTAGQMKEGDVYARLEEKQVRNIPYFGSGNDVRHFASRSQEFQQSASVEWVHPSWDLDKYQLYRMSLETIGLPLSQFQTPKELVHVVRDAMLGHDDAYFNADILHRDISVNSIMIDPETRGGLLVDWSLARDMNDRTASTERAPKCEFIAARLLSHPDSTHTLVDDRESALWVIVWMVREFLRPKINKHYFHPTIFSQKQFVSEWASPFGGSAKECFLLSAVPNSIPLDVDHQDPQITQLIVRLQISFAKRYFAVSSSAPRAYELHHQCITTLSRKGWLTDQLDEALHTASANMSRELQSHPRNITDTLPTLAPYQ